MPLLYPLSMPATPNFRTAELTMAAVSGMTASPFTGEQQVFEWPGTWWEFKGDLPLMKRAQAEPWLAFQAALRGQSQKFLLGDPLGRKAALGSLAGGLSALINVAGQTGKQLQTWGWNASATGILKAGDYFQLPKNYIDGYTVSGFQSGAATVPTITHGLTDPFGTSTADQYVYATTSGSQAEWVGGNAVNADPRGQLFWFQAWLKANSGTPSIQMRVDDGAGANFLSASKVLSTSFALYSAFGTCPLTGDPGSMFASFRLPASSTGTTIQVAGACLYSLSLDARLYKVLSDTDADGSQKATIDIFPRIRTASRWAPIITNLTQNPVGTFRLVSPRVGWSVDQAQTYGLSISAIEAI